MEDGSDEPRPPKMANELELCSGHMPSFWHEYRQIENRGAVRLN